MIKHLNLVKNTVEQSPNGLNNVSYEDFKKITNSYVNHIDCSCLDEFDFETRKDVLVSCIHKLCIGGTLSLRFINMDLLANKIKKSEMTGKKYSEILPMLNSCWSEIEISDVISQTKLTINKMYYDNIYSIITLEKNQ